MQQQKDSALELTCVACSAAFSAQLSPFVACRNAHLSCERCLLRHAQGYEYASFLCPECHAPTCKAAAVKCDWLPSFLSQAAKKMQKTSEENKLLLQENTALNQRLLCMEFKMIKVRSKLEKLEKWRSSFLVNCQKALEGTVSKKLLEGRSEKDMKNAQNCFDSLLAEIRRLVEESKGRQKTIDQLKTENALIAQRFQAIRNDKESVELSWSGTYAKPSTASKSRGGNCSRESLAVEKERVMREDNFLTPSLAEVLRERLRAGQDSEKKGEGRNKTYKKYLNMKIEGLDEKILEANPKFNRLNSNLRKLRDVFDSSTAKKGRPD